MASYTKAEKAKVAEAALQSIATGQSLNAFCKANNYPYKTVSDWLTEDDAANSARARAVELGTHYLAGECLDIADELAAPKTAVDTALGGDGDNLASRVQLAKLRIDTRMRLIGKWNRKDYGEKTALEHSGPNGAPIQTQEVSPRELLAGKLNLLSARGAASGDAGKPK